MTFVLKTFKVSGIPPFQQIPIFYKKFYYA